MRTGFWLSLAACSAPAGVVDTAETGAQDAPASAANQRARPAQDSPTLVTPPAIDVLGADTTWATPDGEHLVKVGASLQWQTAGGEPPTDRMTPDAAVRAGGCSALVHVDRAWIPLRRTEPACSPKEGAFGGVTPTMWSFPGGDIYTLLPGGAVWRHGPKRFFKTPRGRWTGDMATEIVFGSSTYTSVPLDACHRVMVHTQTQAAYRGTRSFPRCEPAPAPYGAFEWTAWLADSGTVLDFREAGVVFVDTQSIPEPQRSTVQVEGNSVQILTGAGVKRELSVDRCTAVDGASGERFARTFPACP